MITRTVARTGLASIAVSGADHCGVFNYQTSPGRKLTFKYEVNIECSFNSLDNRGFVFDQMSVKDYLEQLPPTNLSCEKLADYVRDGLCARIAAENPHCEILRCEVSISPEPYGAWIGSKFMKEGYCQI